MFTNIVDVWIENLITINIQHPHRKTNHEIIDNLYKKITIYIFFNI